MPPSDLPRPPDDCAELELVTVDLADTWWHVDTRAILNIRPPGTPLGRFDCPAMLDSNHPAHFGVWYGSTNPLGAMLEKFADSVDPITEPIRRRNGLGAARPSTPLRLIDLRGAAPLSIYPHLDNRVGNTDRYDICQAWSAAFHRCFGHEVDGLVFVGRLGGPDSVALFEGGHSKLVEEEPLRSLAEPDAAPLWLDLASKTRSVLLDTASWPISRP